MPLRTLTITHWDRGWSRWHHHERVADAAMRCRRCLSLTVLHGVTGARRAAVIWRHIGSGSSGARSHYTYRRRRSVVTPQPITRR